MADIFEQTLKQLNEITDSASQKVGSFFKKAVNKGEEYAVKGKIQRPIEARLPDDVIDSGDVFLP